MHAAKPFIFVHGIRRIVRLARCKDGFYTEFIIYAVVRADAQTLPEAMCRTVRVVACRVRVRLRLFRFAHLRAVVAAIGIRPHAVVAEKVNAALCASVGRRLGAVQEEIRTVEVLERYAVLIDEHAVCIAVNACAEEGAKRVKLHIHAETECAVMIGAVVVLMVE